MEILNKYYKSARTVYTKKLTINEFFAAFKELTEGEQELKAELQTKTVKNLDSANAQMGGWRDNRHKKADKINAIYQNLRNFFLLGRGYTSVYSFTKEDENREDPKTKKILSTTAGDLEKFYSEREENKKQKEKSLNNPETLAEFRAFISAKSKEELTPQQVEQFEKLLADVTLIRQKQDQERNNTVNKIQSENVKFELHQTKHSKTGADIFTVLMINRVEREEFTALRSKAKKLGGYYSRFTNLRATPPIKAGFNFNTEEDARGFMQLKEQDQDTTERTEAREEEKTQTAGERMKERAEKLIKNAEEVINADRLTNTHKRATQAASTEAQARNQIIFAKKLLKIAEGFDAGTIKYLHKLRNGAQLEQLNRILNRGKYNRIHELKLTYTQRQNEEAESKPLEDVNFIKYPFPTYGLNVLKDILLPYESKAGFKMNVKRILEYATRSQTANELVIFTSETQIQNLKKICLKISNEWEKRRILDQITDFERIQKMQLINLPTLKTGLRELISLSKGTELTQTEKDAIQLKELERSFISKKIDGFYPTPEALINRMFSMCKIFEGETILEPSAGLGHIAHEIKNRFPENKLNLIEYNGSLSEVLAKKGFEVENDNFLTTSKKYDVILMNPPFEKSQDIEHINHAFNLLNPGGRLVCIMAGNKSEHSKNTKILNFLDLVEENGYIKENEAGSFKNAFKSTGVNTITVYLEKPEVEEQEEEEAPKAEAKPQRKTGEPFNIPGHLTVFDSGGTDVTNIYAKEKAADTSGQLTMF